jgi:hydrogenase nickel incorporation protein HypB
MNSQPRLAEVRQNVLKQNDLVARELRQRFHEAGVYVVSLVSSPGSGKTAFLEKTLTLLRHNYRVAALVGDLATENDAARLARAQVPVKQITTGTLCHLEAAMVRKAVDDWNLAELDFLFIENVGNLVCPASYDIGEDMRMVLLSVTEGEDKPLKYPHMFRAAEVMILNKIDLLPHLDFDMDLVVANARRVNPDIEVLALSARSGEGLQAWYDWLRRAAAAARNDATP